MTWFLIVCMKGIHTYVCVCGSYCIHVFISFSSGTVLITNDEYSTIDEAKRSTITDS